MPDRGPGLSHPALRGVGSALGSRRVDNSAFAPLGIEDARIRQVTGISSRQWLGDGERLADLAVRAAEEALRDAGVEPLDVGLVIAATLTHDRMSPGLAPEVAHRIHASAAAAVDLNGACSGFVYALDYALLRCSAAREPATVLVIGAEAMSTVVDRADPRTSTLFGDAAGAVVVSTVAAEGAASPDDTSYTVLGADGSATDILYIDRADQRVRMDGPAVYDRAITAMCDAATQVCDAAGIRLADVDLVVPHQANARIVAAVRSELGLPATSVVSSIGAVGNTSAASIPVALDELARDGRLADGTRLLLVSFGAGLSWGAALVRWRGRDRAVVAS